jgi:hypothetical protein
VTSEDEPEAGGMSLVYPFVVCTSHGGPYEDHPFVAGVQFGQIERRLFMAAQLGATTVALDNAVYTSLIPQLELMAMHHGFPVVEAREVDATPDYDAMPEWSFVKFHRGEGAHHA